MAASADDGTAGAEPADTDAGAGRPTSDSEAEGVIPAAKPWAVYLLHCAGGRSYIGISPTPHERFEVHRTGKEPRSRGPTGRTRLPPSSGSKAEAQPLRWRRG